MSWIICGKFARVGAFRTLATRTPALWFRRLKHFGPTKNLNPPITHQPPPPPPLPPLLFSPSDNKVLPSFDLTHSPPQNPQSIVAMSAAAILSRASSRGVASWLRSSSGARSVGFPRVYVLPRSLPFVPHYSGSRKIRKCWGYVVGYLRWCYARILSWYRYGQLSEPLLIDWLQQKPDAMSLCALPILCLETYNSPPPGPRPHLAKLRSSDSGINSR